MIISKQERYFGGVMPPRLYGLAYHDFSMEYEVWYPVPLHWIVRLYRRVCLWWDFRRSTLPRHDAGIREVIRERASRAYNKGFDSGMRNALSDEELSKIPDQKLSELWAWSVVEITRRETMKKGGGDERT